jgi:hypothetical protein
MSVLPQNKVNINALINAGRNRAVAVTQNAPPAAQPYYHQQELLTMETLWLLLASGVMSVLMEFTGFGPLLPFLWPIGTTGLLFSYGKVYKPAS